MTFTIETRTNFSCHLRTTSHSHRIHFGIDRPGHLVFPPLVHSPCPLLHWRMSSNSISSMSLESRSGNNGANSSFDDVLPAPKGKPPLAPRGKSPAPTDSPKSKAAPPNKSGAWGSWHKNAPHHRRGMSFDSLQDLSAPIPLVPLVSRKSDLLCAQPSLYLSVKSALAVQHPGALVLSYN